MSKLIDKLCACYAGCLSRKAMLRPVLLRSFCVLLFCGVVFYLLCRDSSAMVLAKKELLMVRDTEGVLAVQRAMELINLMNTVLFGGILYMGYIIWLGLCSPLFVRRFRDAGLNPKLYGLLFALFAWSGLFLDFSGLRELLYEEAIEQVVRSLMIEGGCVIFTLLILAALALRRSV